MQTQPAPPSAPYDPRQRFLLLLVLGAIVLLTLGGVVGYLIGSAAIGQATLHVSVENRLTSDLSVNLLVNGQLRQTVTIPAGQIVSQDFRVSFATSNGAFFEVKAVSTAGPQDSDTVFVNAPGMYSVSLRLG